MGSSRFIYNYFLDTKETYYKKTKTNLSLKTMKQMLELKQEEIYKWFMEVDSISLTNTLENLDAAYTNYLEKRGNKSVFKKREGRDSYKNKNYSNIDFDFQMLLLQWELNTLN